MTSNLNEKKPDMSLALQALAARMKRKEFNPEIEVPQIIVPVEAAFPVAAAIAKEDEIAEATKHLRIGYRVEDKGIYMGTWQPVDRDGKSLGKTFYVFAAPEDLDPHVQFDRHCRTYWAAAKEVGSRRNWHGHDGIFLKNDAALYKALKDKSAIGKWFIPPRDLLSGKNVDGQIVREDHLSNLWLKGDFKETFQNGAGNYDGQRTYWSCTEYRYSLITLLLFPHTHTFGSDFYNKKDKSFRTAYNWLTVECAMYGRHETDHLLKCRPVRVEPAP